MEVGGARPAGISIAATSFGAGLTSNIRLPRWGSSRAADRAAMTATAPWIALALPSPAWPHAQTIECRRPLEHSS